MEIFIRLMAFILFLLLPIKVVESHKLVHFNCSNHNVTEFIIPYYNYLYIEDCQYFNWSNRIFSNFSQIDFDILTLRNVNFTDPTDLDFSVFSTVTELKIKNTNLQTIPRGLKEHLKTLHIYINNNIAFNSTEMKNLKVISIGEIVFKSSEFNFKNRSIISLDFSHNKNIQLQNYSFAYCTNLSRIVLQSCNLDSIPGTIFRGSENLTYINLHDNKIETLAKNLFYGLTKLEALNLDYNTIKSLPSGIFHSLKTLKILDLNNNELKSLPSGIFDSLNKLKELNLNNNVLKSLPSRFFDSLKNLKDLHLNNNVLNTLPHGIFNSLENLIELHLENNQLKSLPSGIFDSLKNLEKLYLNNNVLKILPNGTFNSLENLIKLYLENNELNSLPGGIFDFLEKLLILNLRNNFLTNLPIGTFEYLRTLDRLDLGYNFLTSQNLSMDIFLSLWNLRYINLEHNLLNKSTDELNFIDKFQYLPNINEINLSNNQNLSFNLCLLSPVRELRTLNLKNTNSSNIFDEKFENCRLSKCTDIDLSYTKINIISLSRLWIAGCDLYNLANNNIEIIDTHFRPKYKKIINLNMDNTTISCNWNNYDFISSVSIIQHTVYILNHETIKCSNNEMMYNLTKNIEHINYPMSSIMDEGYTCPKKCKCFWYPVNFNFMVDCSNRKLKKIPKFWAPTYIPKRGENIEVKNISVDLQNNNIVEGPSQHDGYDNVTSLILSKNEIENISWIPSNIQVLYLDQNKISFLNDQLINSLTRSSIKSLKLGENPFICDCTTVKLKQYLSGIFQVDKENIKCDKTNITIINADNICADESFPWVIIVLVLVLLLFLLSLLASYYKWKKYIKMWLYYKGWLLWFATEEELDKDKVYDVFLSFSQKDDDFVLGTLLPALESGPHPYKVCVHYRDWIPGVLITEQVITSVRDSRRTLVIVSKNFLESCWTKMEFRTAYTQALTEGRTRVIVLVYGEVDMTQIDGDLSIYMKMTTYIKWEDPWFWRKMFYALPHRNRNNPSRNTIV